MVQSLLLFRLVIIHCKAALQKDKQFRIICNAQTTDTGRRNFYLPTSDQSYKTFMLVNYNSRVVIWSILKSCTTLES